VQTCDELGSIERTLARARALTELFSTQLPSDEDDIEHNPEQREQARTRLLAALLAEDHVVLQTDAERNLVKQVCLLSRDWNLSDYKFVVMFPCLLDQIFLSSPNKLSSPTAREYALVWETHPPSASLSERSPTQHGAFALRPSRTHNSTPSKVFRLHAVWNAVGPFTLATAFSNSF
jgi:hypothetical protein